MSFQVSSEALVSIMLKLLPYHSDGVTNDQIREAMGCFDNQLARCAINANLRKCHKTFKCLNPDEFPHRWGFHGEIKPLSPSEYTYYRDDPVARIYTAPVVTRTTKRHLVYFTDQNNVDPRLGEVAKRFEDLLVIAPTLAAVAAPLHQFAEANTSTGCYTNITVLLHKFPEDRVVLIGISNNFHEFERVTRNMAKRANLPYRLTQYNTIDDLLNNEDD